MTYNHPGTGLKLKYGYKDEVVVTDICIDPDSIKNFKGDKSVGRNRRWDQIAGEFDAAFWQHYDYLPVEDALKNAIRMMNPGCFE